MRLELLLKAVDKISRPSDKAGRSVQRLTRMAEQNAKGMAKASRSAEHFERRAKRLRQVMAGRLAGAAGYGLGRAIRKIGDEAIDAGRDVRKFVRDLKLGERAMNGAKRAAGGLVSKLGGMAKWGAVAGVAAGGYAIFDMFRTASQFEQFQIMLEGTEGSAAAARRSMRWVEKFAKQTPYELEEVMAAFVQLRAYGIDPTDGSLRSLGNAAAGMNKGLMQAVEALADAQTGEFERLKEFGITTRVAGERVTLSYTKNNREFTRTVKKSATEINKALTGIFDDRFGGGMVRQSKTFNGLMSNLSHEWTSFQLEVAKAGIFDKVKAGAERLLAKVEELAADGTLKRWAKDISKWLEKAWDMGVKIVDKTDWPGVARDLGRIANAAWRIAKAFASAAEFGEKFGKLHPGWRIIELGEAIGRIGQPRPEGTVRTQRGTRPMRKPAPAPKTGTPRYLKKMSYGPARALGKGGAPTQRVRADGRIDVHIKSDKPVRVSRVRKTGDVDLGVYTGRSLGGVA